MNLTKLCIIEGAHRKALKMRTLCTLQTGASEEEKQKELERISQNASIDDPPTACCRTGCANCVFIVWAETLAKQMQDAGPEITDRVLKMVEDPSMKAYLEMELRLRLQKNS
ncbi:hypothetical protein ACJJTC_017568 [Scirpophaga incertulas]